MDATDRAWFARHPHRRYRIRPAMAGELHGLPGGEGPPLRIIRNRYPRVAITVRTDGVPPDTDFQAAALMLEAAELFAEVRH